MELFQRARVVRLRSHNTKYLLAEHDKVHVCQGRDGSTLRARWEVELVGDGRSMIHLKSCYSKYLSASSENFLLGFTGLKVLQTSPRCLDSSIEWEPLRDSLHVKLKARAGYFLRANGGPPPWRNSVTHDIPRLHHDWVLWEVDIVEIRTSSPPSAGSPTLSFSKNEPFSSSNSASSLNSSSSYTGSSPCKYDSRSIHYIVANSDGSIEDGAQVSTFNFKGNSVEELTHSLEEETELSHVVVCSRSPVNGKLYPLRLHLPPNKAAMNVVVVLASSKVARTFAKQDSYLTN
ncbi:hypothetical protein HPP92_000798 [Vanilla planifolia]|uniref:DUF569 domain-containing protein n=1 Tax=Vanilla planifolia TaxID=51239 RepID=A0A835VLA1_VANPL|nr:hypothetical protein HPP92_000798 [Vanilla planifolia]